MRPFSHAGIRRGVGSCVFDSTSIGSLRALKLPLPNDRSLKKKATKKKTDSACVGVVSLFALAFFYYLIYTRTPILQYLGYVVSYITTCALLLALLHRAHQPSQQRRTCAQLLTYAEGC